MRFRPKTTGIVEGDLTPMIDMTFQLIAFFMLVINFSDAEQDQRVTLPESELAKPPEAPYEHPLTVHLTSDDEYIYGGVAMDDLGQLRSELVRETQVLERYQSIAVADITIVIRADEDAKVGLVQQIIQACQDLKFERFALRGQYSDDRTIGGG